MSLVIAKVIKSKQPASLFYTLNSVMGSGHVKYKKNPLAGKLHGNSAWKIYFLLSPIFTTVFLITFDQHIHEIADCRKPLNERFPPAHF